MKMFKKRLLLIIAICALNLLVGCAYIGLGQHVIEVTGENSFVDSMGKSFDIEEPFQNVVTLYSAHTENAYTIGVYDQIIGVNTASIYPPEAAVLPMYDFRSDPEPLIASQPDAVIIRPFINRNYGDFVRAIEKAGIPVISLYPENQESFDPYINVLGIIFGKEKEAKEQLQLYYQRLEDISDLTATISEHDKVKVYFESTKTAYRTVTLDSNPARGIELAGGINIANDVKPITRGSTIAEYGIEKIMINSDEIEIYVSQRGAMNAGGSLISIPQREGFKAIKAVEEGNILEINEKIISSPTFRYYKGVRELARVFYPDLMDDIKEYDTDKLINRSNYAVLTVKLTNTPIFIPSSSRYYEKNHLVHTYGLFSDVNWMHEDFDYIETAVLHSFIKGYRDENDIEYFDKSSLITRADLAYSLYLMNDITGIDEHIYINDISGQVDEIIIQKVVDNGYMNLDGDGNFNPLTFVTGKEVIETLLRGKDTND